MNARPGNALWPPEQSGTPPLWILAALLGFYVLLRLLAWSNTVLLEDHDSVLYIRQIQAFLSYDPNTIHSLSPDTTPFYPFFGALLSLPGWSAEIGARLCSLTFSALMFVAIAGILGRLAGPYGTVFGLTILALSPYLVTFSISVLSEPTYVAVIYLGFWYFISRHQSTSLWHAAGLGIVFGLGFLNRLEGLLFLLVVPVMQGIHFVSDRRSLKKSLLPLMKWSGVYAAGFMLVAAPQVLMVSDKMNRFALNGREVWAQLQLSPDGGSYDERIYGLKYAASEINLTYLQRVPLELEQSQPAFDAIHLIETFLRNVDKFYALQIGKLGGSLLIALFLFGLLELWRRRKFSELAYVTVFSLAVLLPGLLTDPKPRAVAAFVPVVAALSGLGVVLLSREASAVVRSRWLRRAVPAGVVAVLFAVWLVPFFGIFLKERLENNDYSPVALEPVRSALRDDARRRSLADVVVMSRKQYLPYLADAAFVPLPFTNYRKLLDYARANDVDYLFVEHRLTRHYPFVDELAAPETGEDLELLIRAEDSFGAPLELYKLR